MSETKFTKRRALWLNGATSEQFVVDADNYAVVLSRYPSVYDATEVDQANAALDVAAPDLYAASEKALSALRQYRHFFAQRGIDYPAGIDVEECVIAALAKARGEA